MSPKKPVIHYEQVYKTINGIAAPKVDQVNAAEQAKEDDPASTGTPPPVWESVEGNTAGTGGGPSLGSSNPVRE